MEEKKEVWLFCMLTENKANEKGREEAYSDDNLGKEKEKKRNRLHGLVRKESEIE